jgi:hypothetical protein
MRISSTHARGSGHHGRFPGSFYSGGPFWGDSYYDPSPNVIVVQPPPAPVEHASPPIEERKSAAPLVIEWQGDRYVRLTSDSAGSSRSTQPDYVVNNKPQPPEQHSARAIAPAEPRTIIDPPPTTFIFRDGHHEESSDYTIISGIIYARGDYWASGSWSKQIPLAQLDLPATAKANQDRGAPFRLPTAPNEVITRP